MDWPNFFKINTVKNISFIGFANITGTAITAIFWLYLADVLGSEIYGEISYLMGIGAIATAVSLLGSEQAITVYSAKKINIQPPIYVISLVSSFTSAIILYIAFQHMGLSFFVLGYVIYALTLSETLGRKLYKNYSIYYIIQKILFVIFALILYYIIGPEGILLGYGLSMLFLTKRIYNSLKSSKIDFGILKSKSHFIIHNYILDLTRVSKGQIDKLLIGFFFGFSLLGNYFLALQIISVLSILPGIIIKYTLPEDASGSSTKNLKFITAGFSVVLALLGIFVAPLILPIFFPTYSDAVEFLPLLSISLVPSTVSSLYISKFLGMEKSNYVVVGNMIALITAIIGILILGPIWGVIGLAVTIIISSSSQAIFYACFDFYKFKNNSYIS